MESGTGKESHVFLPVCHNLWIRTSLLGMVGCIDDDKIVPVHKIIQTDLYDWHFLLQYISIYTEPFRESQEDNYSYAFLKKTQVCFDTRKIFDLQPFLET